MSGFSTESGFPPPHDQPLAVEMNPGDTVAPPEYTRDALNERLGTELPAYEHATVEEAAIVSQHFDVTVALGVHAFGRRDGEERDEQAERTKTEPSDVEYDAVARLVDGLRPGVDTLFVEGIGFWQQPRPPIVTGMPEDFRREYTESLGSTIESKRRGGLIDAWQYAAQLADLKGVQVVHADWDVIDVIQSVSPEDVQIRPGRTIIEPERLAILSPGMRQGRDLRARDIMIHWALAKLSSEPVDTLQEEGDQKPRMVLLFGYDHSEGLEDAFQEVEMDVDVIALDHSMADRRDSVESQIDSLNGSDSGGRLQDFQATQGTLGGQGRQGFSNGMLSRAKLRGSGGHGFQSGLRRNPLGRTPQGQPTDSPPDETSQG